MEQLACNTILSKATESELQTLYEHLVHARLVRKVGDVYQIYESAYKDWNQTCYQILFRMMDVGTNKAAYMRLSTAVPYRYILREHSSLQAIEALLLGGSGLLFLYPEDDYTASLKELWNHLANKYNLSPMRTTDWDFSRVRPYNHPTLRLAQLATLLHDREFIVNRIISCRTTKDVEALFCIEASEYWKRHFIPARESIDIPKRIGKAKSHILGINLVVPMQIAYSENIGQQHLKQSAMSLLYAIPAEDNRYIRQWNHLGISPKNAFESQAIIQIITEYCNKGRCSECPLVDMSE